ncbi:CD209 antigen-like protein C isoform X1 [Cetorhinus maximus]
MELDNHYENLENHRDRARRYRGKQENLKSEQGPQLAESGRGKRPSLVIYILLGLSILLSVVILSTAVILFTGISKATSRSLAELRTEISQLKENPLRFQCPDQWKQFQQHCYYISTNKKTWIDAQRACASMDANLVVINKAEEQTFVEKWLQVEDYWIGLSDSISEGDWRWVDGTDYTSSVKFWNKGEPNDFSNEDCAELSAIRKWNDRTCANSQNWICEKPAQCYFP